MKGYSAIKVVLSGSMLSVAIIFCALAHVKSAISSNVKQQSILISSTYRSYFAMNKNGRYKLRNGRPYPAKGEGVFSIKTRFSPANTAFFVIDAWSNMPSKFLNTYDAKITNRYIVPLIKMANKKGYPVYVFTNNCKDLPVAYSCGLPSNMDALIKNNANVRLFYWQGFDSKTFSEKLKKAGIKNIIYTGFHSNMCILERPTGMVRMRDQGFSLYFIPDASAAVELKNTWDNKYIHKSTTKIISRSLARIIKYSDLYKALSY